MVRRGVPKNGISWYLPEWMAACGLSGRGSQARMMELTGWSRATMSQLYNGKQDYSPEIINEAAKALNLEPYELLMHPDKAMLLRQALANARQIVEMVNESDPDKKEELERKFAQGE
jgi:transcriptional regulator with XRE-family HTH domain